MNDGPGSSPSGRAVQALEVGDWPAVLRDLPMAVVSGDEPGVRLARAQLLIAEGMRAQVVGAPLRARHLLAESAQLLPSRMHQRPFRGLCRAVLLPPPPPEVLERALFWRTARVAVREQAGIDERQELLGRDGVTAQHAFVAAAEEFLRWVDGVALRHCREASLRIDWSDRGLADRATALWRLGAMCTPTLDGRALRRAGGRARIEHLALVALAGRELVPSTGPGALPSHVPVRRGHREARRRACQHVADLER